ncbi:hypothetical protein G3A49_13845 [Haloferax volcanii]|uniref:Glycosyltransferase RgtA/B/C/D-like domain-containing protein n=1 Tax=Haloferax volcanii TaxID=2246 RepID=A0A6C0UXL1_HALVO|nr:hypothetical protein [Haloferax alexandrinus]QIB79141.1 hypothetical protein G3A49_13845 [Haloferax alexandrinus]
MSVLLGVIYRTTIWVATPSMIGMDPDKYAVSILAVSNGGIDVLSGGFYANLPLFHTLFTVVFEITGVGPSTALQAPMAILYSTLPVLVTASLAKSLFGVRSSKIGAILASGGSATILYSSLTIPQSHMLLIWYTFVLLLLSTWKRSQGYTFVFLLLIVSMAGTHKLGAGIPFVFILSTIAFLYVLKNKIISFKTERQYIVYLLISGVVFAIQMLYITEWAKAIGMKIKDVFTKTPETTVTVTAASSVGSFPQLFLEHGSWITLLFIGAIAWLGILYTHDSEKVQSLLSVVAVSAFFVVMAIATPFSMSVERAIAIGEPFLIILIVGGLVTFSKRSVGYRYLTPMIVILLLSVQLGTAGAVPDHPAEIQEYLSKDEVEAREWANTHVRSNIYSQYFIAQEIIEYDGPRATFKTGTGGGFAKGWFPLSEFLVTNNLSKVDGCVALRQNQTLVRYNGLFKLNYDPVVQLESSGRTKVYSNEGMSIYC